MTEPRFHIRGATPALPFSSTMPKCSFALTFSTIHLIHHENLHLRSLDAGRS